MPHRIYDANGFCDRKSVTGPDACRRCSGDGIEPRNTYARCERCDGSGYEPRTQTHEAGVWRNWPETTVNVHIDQDGDTPSISFSLPDSGSSDSGFGGGGASGDF